jgi:Ca2+-binding EF-hand superfamily protein
MGNLFSGRDGGEDKPRLEEERMEEAIMLTGMGKEYISKVYEIWSSYDANNDGKMSKEEFLDIPEIKANPLKEGLYQLLDLASSGAGDQEEEVTFNAFVVLLSVMSLDGPLDKKMLYAFRLIDTGDDGRIDEQDLYEYLKVITRFDPSVEADKQDLLVRQAVGNTIAESASNGLFITLEDFQKSMFVCDDFAQRFTLNLKKKRLTKKSDKYKVQESGEEMRSRPGKDTEDGPKEEKKEEEAEGEGDEGDDKGKEERPSN